MVGGVTRWVTWKGNDVVGAVMWVVGVVTWNGNDVRGAVTRVVEAVWWVVGVVTKKGSDAVKQRKRGMVARKCDAVSG